MWPPWPGCVACRLFFLSVATFVWCLCFDGNFSVGSLNFILFISGSRLTRGPRWIRLVPQQSCCPHTQDLPSSQRVGLRDRVGVALARLRATSSGTAIVSPAAGRLPMSSAVTVYVSYFRWTRAHLYTHSGRAERDRASAPRRATSRRMAGRHVASRYRNMKQHRN